MSLSPRQIDIQVSTMRRSGVKEGDLAVLAGFGNRWFVNASVSASGDGKTWDAAFKTVLEAINSAGTNDFIYIAPGSYSITATLSLVTAGVKMIGSGGMFSETTLITGAVDLLDIDASNVEVAGIAFEGTTNAKNCINLADTVLAKNCHIHDCMLIGGGSGKAEYGIWQDATQDSENLIVENCSFKGFDTTALQVNATNATIQNNHITTIAGAIGIEHVPTTGARPGAKYIDNVIMGVASTDTGIKITGTPTAGTYSMIRNMVLNCNTPVTSKAGNDAISALCYVGDASGGALMNPSSA